jgi:hypothetical protein
MDTKLTEFPFARPFIFNRGNDLPRIQVPFGDVTDAHCGSLNISPRLQLANAEGRLLPQKIEKHEGNHAHSLRQGHRPQETDHR